MPKLYLMVKPELIVVGFVRNTVSVLKNESTPGNFNFPGTGDVILPASSATRGAIVADYDGDGDVDLVIGGNGLGGLSRAEAGAGEKAQAAIWRRCA